MNPVWWVSLGRRPVSPRPRARILVLPHAGGGPNLYGQLFTELPGSVAVLGLNLAGRERRRGEAPETDLAEVLDSVMVAASDPPTVVLGHSLGGLLALHVAARLGPTCTSLVISGCGPDEDGRWGIDGTTDHELERLVEQARWIPSAVLDDAGWRARALRTLRADLLLGAQAAGTVNEIRLSVPIHAVAARADTLVESQRLSGLERYTSEPCFLQTVDGGHFAVLEPENRPFMRGLLGRLTVDAGVSRMGAS